MRLRALALVLLLAAAVTAAGCGKSRNSAYVNDLSGYIAALNQICSSVNAQTQSLQPNSLSEIVANGPKLKSIIGDAIKKIDNLKPPDKVKSAVDDFLSKSKQELSKLDDLIAAAKSGDAGKAQQLGTEISQLDSATNQDARTIGATACAQG